MAFIGFVDFIRSIIGFFRRIFITKKDDSSTMPDCYHNYYSDEPNRAHSSVKTSYPNKLIASLKQLRIIKQAVNKEIGQNEFPIPFISSEKLQMSQLMEYNVPREILSFNQSRRDTLKVDIPVNLTVLLEQTSINRTNESKYIEAFTAMIQLEDDAQAKYLTEFNTTNIRIRSSQKDKQFRIERNAKISRIAEAVEESILDYFTLKEKYSDMMISGQVKGCNKEFIFMEVTDDKECDYLKRNLHSSFDIYFRGNRLPFQLQHQALEWIVNHRLYKSFVNHPNYKLIESVVPVSQNHDFRGKLASKLNEEQQTAVINIVHEGNKPLPYLLFGPAGTGKTNTLVAAIEEIVRSTNNSVLVCANSNSACDEITERLLKVLQFGEMFRMYAKSYDHRQISETIKPICNCRGGELRYPSLEFLYQFRVLICTLCTSGCLTRASIDPHFKANHFSHIFIDESASTHETVSMIPIAGLCTSSYGIIHSSVVLAGDPKQLDAVTKSEYAVKLGFKTSFMEHLFEKPLYSRHPFTHKYNHKYITQLVKNYRSHPAILSIPNKLFYDNKLEAIAPADITDWYIGSKLLPSKNFPIILRSVKGFCKRSENHVSLYNMKEVDVVIEYIQKLLENNDLCEKHLTQSDIGVVTPYKLQCKIIARTCRQKNFNDVTIGTVEVFQGQEKPVMIVSTVRTGKSLGFVKDPRRFNVVITRAKCLLIIVGDHRTLDLDNNWHQLVKLCFDNKAIIFDK